MPFSATRDLWLVLKARDEGSRALRSFSRDIRMVGDSVQMANLLAARSALSNQMATAKLSGASQQQLLAIQNQIGAVDQQIGSMKLARAEMEEQRFSSQRLSSALMGTAGTFATIGTAAVAAGAFAAMGLKDLVDSAVEYQRQSALTLTQVTKFGSSLKEVEDIGLRVARAVGVPFEQIQPALYDIFSSMDISVSKSEELLTTFAKAAVAGQVDIEAASRATIGIMNAFQLPIEQVNHLMDIQFQLVKEGIGSYEEWTTRIGLVTPSAVRFGQTFETMAAALAASTRFGISAARSGTAVARAMDAMSNPVAVENLRALGIAATDADGNFRPMLDILKDFRGYLETIPGQEDKVKAILDVFKGAGGTIEARRFLQNVLITPGDLELFETILGRMGDSTGSFEQAYAIMADTTATKSQLMENAWDTIKVKAGEVLQPTFERIIGFFTRLFDWFNNLTPAQQSFIVKLIAFAVVLTTVMGILALISSALIGFAAAVTVAGTGILLIVGGVAAAGIAFAVLATALYVAWQRSEAFRAKVQEIGQGLYDFYQNYLVPVGNEIATTWNDKVWPALQALWQVIQDKVLPVLSEMWDYISSKILPVAEEWGNHLKDFVIWAMERVAQIIKEDVIPAINFLTKYYQDHKAAIDEIISAVIFLLKWLGIIVGFILGVLVVAFIGPVVAAFMAVAGVIFLIIDTIVRLIEGFKALWKHIQEWAADVGKIFSPDEWARVGSGMIDGLINGIKNKFQAVKDTISNLSGSALKWMMDKLGMASPSKEFMKIGELAMTGFNMGINKMTPAVEAQVVNSTGALTQSASSAVSNGRYGGSNQQVFNITTQEINPRAHAAELGWLLNGRS